MMTEFQLDKNRPYGASLICSSTALAILTSSDVCELSAAQRIQQYLLHARPGHNHQSALIDLSLICTNTTTATHVTVYIHTHPELMAIY